MAQQKKNAAGQGHEELRSQAAGLNIDPATVESLLTLLGPVILKFVLALLAKRNEMKAAAPAAMSAEARGCLKDCCDECLEHACETVACLLYHREHCDE